MNVLNSVGVDEPEQTRGVTTNPAFLHPEDLAALGLEPGDLVEIRSARAAIPAIVEADAHLRRGLVSMTHSWGDRPERDADVRAIGANTGRLTSVDDDYERYTGLPRNEQYPRAHRDGVIRSRLVAPQASRPREWRTIDIRRACRPPAGPRVFEGCRHPVRREAGPPDPLPSSRN